MVGPSATRVILRRPERLVVTAVSKDCQRTRCAEGCSHSSPLGWLSRAIWKEELGGGAEKIRATSSRRKSSLARSLRKPAPDGVLSRATSHDRITTAHLRSLVSVGIGYAPMIDMGRSVVER